MLSVNRLKSRLATAVPALTMLVFIVPQAAVLVMESAPPAPMAYIDGRKSPDPTPKCTLGTSSPRRASIARRECGATRRT